MIKFLKNLNTNLNLFKALFKKFKNFVVFLKKHKLLTIFIVIVLLILGFIAYNKFVPKPPEKLYQLTTAKIKDLSQTVSASGKIHSATEVSLKFQTSGQLAWVGVKTGDKVNKWQAIASLDQRTLYKTLQQDLIDYSKERNDFEEDRLVTYDSNNMEITNTMKRVLEKNQWDLEKAVLDVEIQNIALQYSSLLSPIDGIVTSIDVPVAGVNITPTTAYFTVADPEHLEFHAEIDEADIGLIEASQSASLLLDAYPDEPIPLTVDWIDFNSTLDSSGSTVYIVKFYIKNDNQKYRLGMNGEITITTQEKKDVLTVPFESLIESDSKTIIQVVKDNKVVDQPVTTGLIGQSDIEITNGLTPDQTIVVSELTKK